MSENRQRYLNILSDIMEKILIKYTNTGQLTEADIIFINMYKNELNKSEKAPAIDTLIDGAKKIIGMLNSVPQNDEEDTVDEL